MIPVFEINKWGDLTGFVERGPLAYDEWMEGFDGQGEYGPMPSFEWQEVEDALRAEGDVLTRLDATCESADDFDEAASGDESLWEAGFPALDVGVIGPVMALSAAGFVPSCSCRGHTAPSRGWEVPFVRLFTDGVRLRTLQRLCREDAGLHVYGPGVIEVVSETVLGLRSLAERVYEAREDFRALPELVAMPEEE